MAKKRKITCLSCGKGMRGKWAACPRCGKPSLARNRRVAKASAPSFIARTAAAPVMCLAGHPNRAGAKCCTTCGQLLPGQAVPPLSMVTKSALADNFWRVQTQNSPDPAVRELYRRARLEGGAW